MFEGATAYQHGGGIIKNQGDRRRRRGGTSWVAAHSTLCLVCGGALLPGRQADIYHIII